MDKQMRENYIVITFYSTYLALEFERIMKERGISIKMVPVPRQISSSCGIAARLVEEEIEGVREICQQEGVEHDDVYRVYADKKREPELLRSNNF